MHEIATGKTWDLVYFAPLSLADVTWLLSSFSFSKMAFYNTNSMSLVKAAIGIRLDGAILLTTGVTAEQSRGPSIKDVCTKSQKIDPSPLSAKCLN